MPTFYFIFLVVLYALCFNPFIHFRIHSGVKNMDKMLCIYSAISFRLGYIYTPEVQRCSHPTILISIWCQIFLTTLNNNK